MRTTYQCIKERCKQLHLSNYILPVCTNLIVHISTFKQIAAWCLNLKLNKDTQPIVLVKHFLLLYIEYILRKKIISFLIKRLFIYFKQ